MPGPGSLRARLAALDWAGIEARSVRVQELAHPSRQRLGREGLVERGPLAERFEVRLRELRMKERDVRELMGRVRRGLAGGEGGAA